MNKGLAISERVEHVRNVFQAAQAAADEHLTDEVLIQYLEHSTDPPFRSVAYEGASYARGLQSLSNDNNLTTWLAYMQRVPQHAVQVYIGLGWSFAQQRLHPRPLIDTLDPLMQPRVFDGMGYYDGTFRQRHTIHLHKLPEGIEGSDLRAYNQGLGRCLWYVSKGNSDRLAELIGGFDPSRMPDLWRGAGIAIAYVGCIDESGLNALNKHAGIYGGHLAIGAALTGRTRSHAGLPSVDTDLVCQVLCGMNALACKKMTEEAEKPAKTYFEWLEVVGSRLEK